MRRNLMACVSPTPRLTYCRFLPHIPNTRSKEYGSGVCVKGNMEERACDLALYIIENKTTVRAAAQKFGISKSTVHMVVTYWNG